MLGLLLCQRLLLTLAYLSAVKTPRTINAQVALIFNAGFEYRLFGAWVDVITLPVLLFAKL